MLATLIHEPQLLILDEPFSGLDPVNVEILRDLILDQRRAGRTVIFSTHGMEAGRADLRFHFPDQRRQESDDGPLSAVRNRRSRR